ncbi:MAG: hypothetical protein FJ207_12865 [Gemmatimonadetes bacterium]|nr:hypothetical protein [Gemmatimonadota bacterium]
MKKLLCTVALVGMLVAPGAVQAQMNAGPILAYHTDGESIGAGGFIGIPLTQLGEGFGIVPNFIWWFPDVGTMFEINGDVSYFFPVAEDSPVMPFAFGGLNIFRTSFDLGGTFGSVSSTDVGLNLGGGVQFPGSLQPFAGAKF